MDEYLKDPIEIERRSFIQIRELTNLSGFDDDQQQVVMRMVHTCGNPDVAADIRISNNAINAGLESLRKGCATLCDVEMVKQGLNQTLS